MIIANDIKWDRKLNIDTNVPDFGEEDYQNYGYDPTPYIVLEELIKTGYITKGDVLIDYGCGKGRVEFFLNNQIGCKTIGIDHSKRLINKANENLEKYGKNNRIKFIHSKADDYDPKEANLFYLFNPFSVNIFKKVLERIKKSLISNPREITIFFYYPTTEYRMFFDNDEKSLVVIDTISFSEILNDFACKLMIFKLNTHNVF